MSDEYQFAESGGGPQSYHFIPATAKDELRLVQEVLTLALTGKSSQDADVWVHPETGEMQITAPRGVSTVQEWQSSIQRRVIASLAITNALKESDLRALVQSKDGMLHRIDRMYWLRTNVGAAEAVCQFDGMVPDGFVGQPILVDVAELGDWRAVTDKALALMMPTPEPTGVDVRPESGERWLKLKPNNQQLEVMRFFAQADKSGLLPGGEKRLATTALRDVYVREWIKRGEGKRGGALTREPFEKWLGRYLDGWRAPVKGQVGWQRMPQ